jgi:hypothetical protein
MSNPDTVPCMLCGRPTAMTGTKRCDPCWELERRVKMDPVIAHKVLTELQMIETPTRLHSGGLVPSFPVSALPAYINPAPHAEPAQAPTPTVTVTVGSYSVPTKLSEAVIAEVLKQRRPGGLLDGKALAGLRPCRSPYCECEPGACTHPGCYDARHQAAPPEVQAATDAALDLVELPPIRVDTATYKALKTLGQQRGMILQPLVREAIQQMLGSAADPSYVTIHVDDYDRLGCCRRMLEMIAAGESEDPQADAKQELDAHGFWDPKDE